MSPVTHGYDLLGPLTETISATPCDMQYINFMRLVSIIYWPWN